MGTRRRASGTSTSIVTRVPLRAGPPLRRALEADLLAVGHAPRLEAELDAGFDAEADERRRRAPARGRACRPCRRSGSCGSGPSRSGTRTARPRWWSPCRCSRTARRAAARGCWPAAPRRRSAWPPASVSRPSAKRVAPYGTTAARRGLSRFERSQALSFTNRLAPRPLGCEPLSVVTVTGSERVSFPAASITDAWTVCVPFGSWRCRRRVSTSVACWARHDGDERAPTARPRCRDLRGCARTAAVDDDPDLLDAAAAVGRRERDGLLALQGVVGREQASRRWTA